MGRNSKKTRQKADEVAMKALRAADQEFLERTGSSELQSPFSWELDTLSNDKGVKVLLDHTRHCGSDWTAALGRILCAYQLYCNGEGKAARDLLEENYELLKNLHDDELIARYRPALKHVLDSTWLKVRLELEVPFPDGTSEEDVVNFSALDKIQQGAVWAIRATMGEDEWNPNRKRMRFGFIKKALELCPHEGQWKLYLGNAMLRSRDGFGSYKVEVAVMDEAYRLRKNPETTLGLASALMLEDTSASKERCVTLTKQVMELYPGSAYACLECARIWSNLSGRFRNARLAEECHRCALKLAPDWMLAHLQFGSFCRSQGRMEEGLKHLRAAAKVHEDDVRSYFPTNARFSAEVLEFWSHVSMSASLQLHILLSQMIDWFQDC